MSSEKLDKVMNRGLEDQEGCSSLEDFDREENSDGEYDIVGGIYCVEADKCGYCMCPHACERYCATYYMDGSSSSSPLVNQKACVDGCMEGVLYCCGGATP